MKTLVYSQSVVLLRTLGYASGSNIRPIAVSKTSITTLRFSCLVVLVKTAHRIL